MTAVEGLIQFYKWDSTAIHDRQEMLVKQARKISDMPQGKAEAGQ